MCVKTKRLFLAQILSGVEGDRTRNENLVGAHDALNDTRATYEVFKAQLQSYENVAYEDKEGNISYPIKNHLETLAAFTPFNLLDPTGKIVYDKQGREILNFGKHKGKTLIEAFQSEPNYYNWMMSKNFSVFTKRVIKQAWESINKDDS